MLTIKSLLKSIPGVKALARSMGLMRPQEPHSRRFLLEMLPKNSVGAEIGVHKGGFSKQILRIVNPQKLHLIDPWKHEEANTYKDAWYGGKVTGGQSDMDARHEAVRAKFETEIDSGQIVIHRGYSNEMLQKFDNESLDWVYIDGNHLYEFVKQDLELGFQKTKLGGYITGDDYTTGGWWQGGVKKAVDEFAKKEAVELVKLQRGQFILKKVKH
ncbi:MAG: class I SAM-dependent methyltransferase [Cyanobacteriota bacterium]|nr:class I SAM-dependent methyltransferase [Cyanobacteriota bacterium]